MGKGDKRTRKGKIIAGTYGVYRPKKKNSASTVVAKKAVVKKAEPKKVEAKKAEPKKNWS